MKLIFLFLLLGVRSSGHGNVPACSSGSTQRMVSDTRRAHARAPRRIPPPPHRAPPPPNAVDRKRRRVVVDANAYPSGVSRQVVHAVRNRLAFRGDEEVVHPHPLRRSLRTPLSPGVLEVPDQLLLLGVHRDHRLPGRLLPAHLSVDVSALGVAVRMPRSFFGFLICLKTVSRLAQQRPDGWV